MWNVSCQATRPKITVLERCRWHGQSMPKSCQDMPHLRSCSAQSVESMVSERCQNISRPTYVKKIKSCNFSLWRIGALTLNLAHKIFQNSGGSYPALLSSKILQLSTFQDLYDHVWPHPSTCTETWKVTRKHLTHRSARLRRSLLTQGMRFRHLPRKGIVHTLVMWCHVPPSLGRDCGALWCQQGDQRCDPKITKAFQGIPRHQKPAGSDGKSLPCQRALPSTGRTSSTKLNLPDTSWYTLVEIFEAEVHFQSIQWAYSVYSVYSNVYSVSRFAWHHRLSHWHHIGTAPCQVSGDASPRASQSSPCWAASVSTAAANLKCVARCYDCSAINGLTGLH